MSKYFERQLEELHVQLITLGSYCEKAISFSAKAIQNVQNEEIARQVFETDRDIDAKEREIENLCLSLSCGKRFKRDFRSTEDGF